MVRGLTDLEQFGEDSAGAKSPQVQNGGQDAFGIGDLLEEDSAAEGWVLTAAGSPRSRPSTRIRGSPRRPTGPEPGASCSHRDSDRYWGLGWLVAPLRSSTLEHRADALVEVGSAHQVHLPCDLACK